jgi:hypothetical protein
MIIRIDKFQVLKGYLPHQWNKIPALFFRASGLDANYYNGDRWTTQLIAFYWTQSHTLWKVRRESAHISTNDNSDMSNIARTRQPAQHRVEMMCTYDPFMVSHDRRTLDIPLEERLQSRTSDLVAMFPVIHQSIREVRSGTTSYRSSRYLLSFILHGSGIPINHERDAQHPDSIDHCHSFFVYFSAQQHS